MKFLKEIDTDKTSFSRFSGFILILSYIIWSSYIVYTTKHIPDFPSWLAVTIMGLYGINRFAQPVKQFIQATISAKGKLEKGK